MELKSDSRTVPSRVIVKLTVPPESDSETVNQDDPYEHVREFHAYQLLPDLGVPTAAVYFKSMLKSGENALIMEDLTLRANLRGNDHKWSFDEARSILDFYVRLHLAGLRESSCGDLRARWPWLSEHEGSQLKAPMLSRMLKKILASPVTGARLSPHAGSLLSICDRMESLKKHLASRPQTFNYNDFFPGNVAVPDKWSPADPAILFDWHLLGTGPVEQDLLNVFYGDHFSLINVDECLEHYISSINTAAGTSYKPGEVRNCMKAAELLGVMHSLWMLSGRLPAIELGKRKLPGWLDSLITRIQNGYLDELLSIAGRII
ncbi:MAG: phosphotransferase [Candidatus Wallbacteria bacterium]|nr:phosphotransferase [Candidatus Wallbacteria bacterium]